MIYAPVGLSFIRQDNSGIMGCVPPYWVDGRELGSRFRGCECRDGYVAGRQCRDQDCPFLNCGRLARAIRTLRTGSSAGPPEKIYCLPDGEPFCLARFMSLAVLASTADSM